ncbi:MAG TPA: PhoH family protein [Mariprofundaceae bacterium]|nr:PhoH family protein [Mariprofundaceae bacterium]
MNIPLRLEALAPAVLQQICGPGNRILQRIEKHFGVRFLGQPGDWHVEGDKAEAAAAVILRLTDKALNGPITDVIVEGMLRDQPETPEATAEPEPGDVLIAGRRHIRGKTANQRKYLKTIQEQVLTIAVGPAGSGKTYLAVAAAVAALAGNQVERIILTRPAVEAGEKLGFLPGDLQQKIDPYLRPLFDALADMLGLEKMNAMQESGRIEIAPLAYMRGRTLNDAFVILDEAQNTTREQMKMFLTRLGFGSKMVVTGDVTQVDLPRHQHSGLMHALDVLADVEEVGTCRLTGRDVVRHRLVERIVNAYEQRADD